MSQFWTRYGEPAGEFIPVLRKLGEQMLAQDGDPLKKLVSVTEVDELYVTYVFRRPAFFLGWRINVQINETVMIKLSMFRVSRSDSKRKIMEISYRKEGKEFGPVEIELKK